MTSADHLVYIIARGPPGPSGPTLRFAPPLQRWDWICHRPQATMTAKPDILHSLVPFCSIPGDRLAFQGGVVQGLPMNKPGMRLGVMSILVCLACAAGGVLAQSTDTEPAEGARFQLASGVAAVKTVDMLPYVESEFTHRYRFDSADNPKLVQLRRRFQLDTVVAPGRDEFDRQVHLLDWVHHRFKRFGRPSVEARGALEILMAIEEGNAFFCTQYAHVFVSAAASLGWVDRELALRRHQDPPEGGSSEHSTTEIWSNQYRKWVMMDPTANMHIVKDGVPLNGWEIRQEWFHRGGRDLVFVIGKERKQYRKADLPIFLKRFEGFGDLTVPVDELNKYGFMGYIPNTDLMDSALDYAGMFIVKDELCEGTRWHTRIGPSNPAVDPYFPIGQVALKCRVEQGRLRVSFRTMTPNFKRYETRANGGDWVESGDSFLWELRPGLNRLEARTVNRFGVQGPASTLEVQF